MKSKKTAAKKATPKVRVKSKARKPTQTVEQLIEDEKDNSFNLGYSIGWESRGAKEEFAEASIDPLSVAQWRDPTEWRLAGLYAAELQGGGSLILRSISVQYSAEREECILKTLSGGTTPDAHVKAIFGPIPEQKESN